MPEYKKHIYDVELRQNYFELCKLLDENVLTTKISKEEYISRIRTTIKDYCKKKKIPLDFSKFPKKNYPPYIIVSSDEPSYESNLGFMLIWYEPMSIPLLLDHHKKHYKGEKDFVGLVEYLVLSIVRDYTPIENTERLQMILNWVREQKLTPDRTNEKQINQSRQTETKKEQLSIREIALRQFFIYKYEKGKEIVKGNANSFFEGTTHKTTARLIKWFNEYKKDTNRLGFNSQSGRTDTKQLNEQKQRYIHILPTLINFRIAYSEAKKELENLIAK